MAELKNVIVVGAATGGINAARSLSKSLPSTHRVVLIEANEVAFWPIGGLRAAVEPGFEEQVVADLNTNFLKGQHKVLAGTQVVALEPTAVVVDRVSGLGSPLEDGKERIPFDRIVLALGASYAFPCRPAARDRAGILAAFKKSQKEIAAASNFLIIGGGPTAVEFAGEVLDKKPDASITLVSRSKTLVAENVSNKLKNQLQKRKVKLLLEDEIDADLQTGPVDNQTYTTKKGASVKADYVLLGTGGRPNTDLIAKTDKSVLNNEGRIRVNKDLTIRTTSSFDWTRYTAVGDCADLPVAKTSMAAEVQGATAGANVLAAINGGKLKNAPAPPNAIIVPIGKSAGAGYMMFFGVGEWFTSLIKGKGLFVSKFKGSYV